MDDLIDSMAEAKVDPTSLGDHPRFSQFKNAARAAEKQVQRREEWLNRHVERRHNHHNHMRKLAENEFDSDDEADDMGESSTGSGQDQPIDLSAKKQKRYKSRYADELMLSEWLVDIPDELSEEWIMVPSPVGKRCLVVTNKGVTSAYAKNGKLMHQFSSCLPQKAKGTFTIMDCIFKDNIFYCLDLLAWAGMVYSDNSFETRRFILNSRLEENPILLKPNSKIKFCFRVLPQCLCSKVAMAALLKDQITFDLDGLLFYHSQEQYTPGMSPMVGWLKPWMLPEVLGVDIPEKFHESNAEKQTSAQFINTFNEKYGHVSNIEKAEGMVS